MNKAILIGRLGRDPELRTTESGKDVCTFSVATTERYGGEAHATWHNCVAWGQTAKMIAEYLAKGREIAIEGRISNRSYDKDGQTKWVSEVIVDRFEFVGSKAKSDDTPADTPPQGGDDDLPF